MSYARIIVGSDLSIVARSFCILIATILATITYYYVEKPVRNKNAKIKYLIIILIIIGACGYLVDRKDGFINRTQYSEIISKQFDWNTFYNKSKECQEKFPGDDYCNIYDVNSFPNVAIIGDSHANHFFYGLSEFYKNKNRSLSQL